MNSKLNSVKNTIVRNRGRILLTTTAVLAGAVVLQRTGLKQHDDFLKEHDLYETFYTPEA